MLVAEQRGCASCLRTGHLKMVKVRFCIFYHNKKVCTQSFSKYYAEVILESKKQQCFKARQFLFFLNYD